MNREPEPSLRLSRLLIILSASLLNGLLIATPSQAASSFTEVRTVLMTDPVALEGEAIPELEVYQKEQLPAYKVNRKQFFAEIDGQTVNVLEQDAKRTIAETADYYDRVKKLLHPNGICLTGTWEITEPSVYTGYFAQGKKALMIARASTAMGDTQTPHKRGFGFAGKLFPTENPEQAVDTANFFAIDVLSGTKAGHYLDVAMTNEPKIGFSLALGTAITASQALSKADTQPGFRPLYPISELGLTPGQAVVTPKWIMLKAAANMPRIQEADFRDELSIQHYPNGLVWDIYVSDKTNDTTATKDWMRLGFMTFDESIVSYGCDRRLHFAHPKIK